MLGLGVSKALDLKKKLSSQAKKIETNQLEVHPDLIERLQRHQDNLFKRPIAQHTRLAFYSIVEWLEDWQGDVILDTCCGVGESSINIARDNPHSRVVGIDKSIQRLAKHSSYAQTKSSGLAAKTKITKPSNYMLLQADLNDFWRLLNHCIEQQKPAWKVIKQYILYPNPYPKKTQLGKRWHASAMFPDILKTCKYIEVRSNWEIYVEEFKTAVEYYGLLGELGKIEPSQEPITPFERKYLASNQTCFRLDIRPAGSDKE